MNNLFINAPTGWHQVSYSHFKRICEMKTFEEQFKSITGREWRTVTIDQMHLYDWIREAPTFENHIPELFFNYNNETYHFLGGVSSNDIGQIPLGVIADCNTERGRNDESFMLACLYWKKGEKYDAILDQINARAKMFEELPMTIVFGIHNFFLFLSQSYVPNIPKPSNQMVQNRVDYSR